jgi:2-C-methyl-D-erythritol 2,4-cyclodiphosphate synthase
MLEEGGWEIENVDAVVVLESPPILPHIARIRSCLAEDMGVTVDRVTVKGKTAEGLDSVGAGTAVAAHAVALIKGRDE